MAQEDTRKRKKEPIVVPARRWSYVDGKRIVHKDAKVYIYQYEDDSDAPPESDSGDSKPRKSA